MAVTWTENELRSTLAMFGVGCFARSDGVVLTMEERIVASLLTFAHEPYSNAIREALEPFDSCDGASITTGLDGSCYFEATDPLLTPGCIYCTASGARDNPPCVLALPSPSEPFNSELCADALAAAGESIITRPLVTLDYQDGYTDVEGDSTRWTSETGEDWRYYLRSPRMLVDPCADDVEYCDEGVGFSPWLCRWYTQNEAQSSAWRMYCNGPLNTGSQTAVSQNVDREFRVSLVGQSTFTRPPVFVRFGFGATSCWDDFDDVYCYSDGCWDPDAVPPASTLWGCVGAERSSDGQARVDAISDDLLLIADPQINVEAADYASGGRYPHARDGADLKLKQLCWDEVAKYLAEQFDAGLSVLQHSSGGPFDAPSKSRWSSGPTIFQGRIVSNTTIRLNEPRLGWTPLVARLELDTLAITLTLNVEPRLNRETNLLERRVFAAIHFVLQVKVVRYAATDAALLDDHGHNFVSSLADDPTDLDVLNPVSGGAHPNITLMPTAVIDGEDAIIPQTMHWHGLKAVSPYSLGVDTYEPPFCAELWEGPLTCCDAYYEIDRTTIHGEVNDHGSPTGPQRYKGSVGLRVKNLNSSAQNFGCRCGQPA